MTAKRKGEARLDRARLLRCLEQFPNCTVAVLGDLVADRYVFGRTSRVSREAPVLILNYEWDRVLLGGGGNAAHNVRSLGGIVYPIGVTGDDLPGFTLMGLLQEKGIDTRGVLVEEGRQTATKTRILAGGHHATTARQQIVRIDRAPTDPLSPQTLQRLLACLEESVAKCRALLVSDYSLGVVKGPVVDAVNSIAARGDLLVTVDSRRNLLNFKNPTAVTPNEPEVDGSLGMETRDDNIALAGATLLEKTGARGVLITRGNKGMALFERGQEPVFIDIYGGDEVADVTGAGDTVIGTFTLALVAGATMAEAAMLANYAGGIVVMKSGTGTVSLEELQQAVETDATAEAAGI
ncbi:MAG: hypothetical protein HYY65_15200 [Candidatus Tectomicrobia bacterium]|uniref:Carbohydrate kinase PfkB domain-containing protein n=1 Tax=Tectimicrobiota bacterium TaxID=2528274 RepID=A0A932GS45_UNCTE|nr:hypothetical protein [Candidatus Tectomicrobia bacterium]